MRRSHTAIEAVVNAMNVKIKALIQNSTWTLPRGHTRNSAVKSIAKAKEMDCSMNNFPIGRRRHGKNAYRIGTAVVPMEAMTTQTNIHAVSTRMSSVISTIPHRSRR